MGKHNSVMGGSLGEASGSERVLEKYRQNDMVMVQNILLVWLDVSIVKDSVDYENTITLLRSVIHTIKTYTDSKACIQFIKTVSDTKVCVLISGSLGEHLVPRMDVIPQVDSVFVFCNDPVRHRKWAKKYPKVKGVFTEIIPICEALKQAAKLCERNSTPISMVPIDNDIYHENFERFTESFVYTQILKEILLTIEFEEKHITEFSNHCRVLFVNNQEGLKNVNEFEQNYRQYEPSWWYTNGCFLRPMLDCAINQMNLQLIIKMGFFIGDLHRQIDKSKNQHTGNILRVYRGQGVSISVFNWIKEAKNGLISFNNFLSTSRDAKHSLEFAELSAQNPSLVGILFDMRIDLSESPIPFACISNVSSQEDEVLFPMHTVFRIDTIESVDCSHGIFQVKLTVINEIDERLQVLSDCVREENFPESKGWYRLGSLLLKIGHCAEAQQIYEMLLEKTTDENEKALIYTQLGWIKSRQGEPKEATTFIKRSIAICEERLPENHPDLATSFYNLGSVYQSMGKHAKALNYHEKALLHRQKSLPPNHPDLAASYREIGCIYFSLKEYWKALASHEKALIIGQKSLLPNHPDLVSFYNNIAELYHAKKKYSLAIPFYEKSLVIKQQTLFRNHPSIAIGYSNIARMHRELHQYMQALSFYEKALEIYKKNYPPNFRDFAQCYGNIGWMHEENHDNRKAYSAYEHAVNIGESVPTADHRDLQQQQQRRNLERVKHKS